MNDLSNTPAKMGDNRPPIYDPDIYADFDGKVRDFADAAAAWKEAGAIESQEQAEKANDFLAGARKLFKEVDDRRKVEKQPHLDAGKTIDSDFGRLKDLIEKAVAWVKTPLAAYMQEQERIAAQKRAEAEAKARAEAEAAAEAVRQAEARNDLVGAAEAEEAAKAAEKAAKAAEKIKGGQVGSATGGGRTAALRTVRHAEIANINTAFLTYRAHPEIAETLVRLANADLRSAKGADIDLPGFTIITERKL